MYSFLVSYDLMKRKDYPRLWEALRALGGVRVLASAWIVKGNWTSQQVCTYLRKFIDEDDRIVVVRFDEGWEYQILNKVS